MTIRRHGHPELGNPEENCWCRFEGRPLPDVKPTCDCRLGFRCNEHTENEEDGMVDAITDMTEETANTATVKTVVLAYLERENVSDVNAADAIERIVWILNTTTDTREPPGGYQGQVHSFTRSRFTNTTTCEKCGLLPLDGDDYNMVCNPTDKGQAT